MQIKSRFLYRKLGARLYNGLCGDICFLNYVGVKLLCACVGDDVGYLSILLLTNQLKMFVNNATKANFLTSVSGSSKTPFKPASNIRFLTIHLDVLLSFLFLLDCNGQLSLRLAAYVLLARALPPGYLALGFVYVSYLYI